MAAVGTNALKLPVVVRLPPPAPPEVCILMLRHRPNDNRRMMGGAVILYTQTMKELRVFIQENH